MRTGATELVFILDRSGSMGGLESDTIGGFNGMIARQKAEQNEANVTTVLFDDNVEIIHDRFPIESIAPLTEEEYFVRGCTALLDAVGETVEKVDRIQAHLPEAARAKRVIFVITTDGLENSSERYTYDQIERMIRARKENGWEFLFLGANIDAAREAERIGIARNRSVTYENDAEGVAINFKVLTRALSNILQAPSIDDSFDDDWAEEITEYKNKRQGRKRR